MKKFEKIKKVKYVDSYVDAPKNAQYILRRTCGDMEWELEEYSEDGEYTLNETFISHDSTLPEDFHAMLQKARALMPDKATLWVEKPRLYEGYSDELNKLYAKLINDPINDDDHYLVEWMEEEEFWMMFSQNDNSEDPIFPEYDDECDEHDEYDEY